jgi:RNA recognition motif-containing protein
MSRHRDWDPTCKVYVGNLGTNGDRYDLEDAFGKYGNVRNVWVAKNPPGFAFVEFDDSRDAEDSVRGLDGTRVCGVRVRVEMSNGGKGGGRNDRGSGRRGDTSAYRRSRSQERRTRRSPSYRSMSRSNSKSKDRGQSRRSRSKSDH